MLQTVVLAKCGSNPSIGQCPGMQGRILAGADPEANSKGVCSG